MSTTLAAFTLFHVVLSVLGLVAGLIVAGGLIAGNRLERWTAVFFISTALTSITGFGFPAEKLLPSHLFGILSLLILPVAAWARYGKRLAGGWRRVYVAGALAALYLNAFVLFAQLFAKTPALIVLAPTPASPVFGAIQFLLLVLFVGLGRAASGGFRNA